MRCECRPYAFNAINANENDLKIQKTNNMSTWMKKKSTFDRIDAAKKTPKQKKKKKRDRIEATWLVHSF